MTFMADSYFNYNNLEAYMQKMQLQYDPDFLRWIRDIINTKITMFQYENLPEDSGLTSEIMERALMFNNFLCGYQDSTLGFIICRWRPDSDYDLYWKPITVSLSTISGRIIKQKVPYKDIVLFRDNPMDIIPFLTLNAWITKIREKEMTLDNIFTWLSLPAVFSGDKDQITSLKQVAKKAELRTPFAFAAKNFKDHLEQFDIKLPVELADVYDIMKKYRGLTFASMGIYEVDEKRERIVTSEIQAQNDYVDFVYTGMYNERTRFVNEVNERYGLNIKLRESYVENQKDNIDLQRKMSEAKDHVKVEVAEINAEAEVEAAKVGGQNNGTPS